MSIYIWIVLSLGGVLFSARDTYDAAQDLRRVNKFKINELQLIAKFSLRKQISALLALISFNVAGILAFQHHGYIGVPSLVEYGLISGLFFLVSGSILNKIERILQINNYKERNS